MKIFKKSIMFILPCVLYSAFWEENGLPETWFPKGNPIKAYGLDISTKVEVISHLLWRGNAA